MTIRARRLACGLGGITASLLLAAGCGGAAEQGGAADGKIKVVASTNVWGSVASAVGAGNVAVTSIINSPNDDPHNYESTSEDALTVSEADLVVSNGGGYDAFFADAVGASGAQPKSVVAFDLAGKTGGHEHEHGGHEHGEHEHGEHGHGEHGHEHGGGHEHGASDAEGAAHGGETNEHVFYELSTVEQVAQRVAEQLGAIAPDQRATFTANAEKFVAGVHRLQQRAEQIGEQHSGARALATEPVAGYLLETAGVRDETPAEFAEAVEHDVDIPAQALAQTRSLVEQKRIDLVLRNSQTETQTTGQLVESARSADIPVVSVTETLPRGSTGYLAWMGDAVDALAGAFDRPAAP